MNWESIILPALFLRLVSMLSSISAMQIDADNSFPLPPFQERVSPVYNYSNKQPFCLLFLVTFDRTCLMLILHTSNNWTVNLMYVLYRFLRTNFLYSFKLFFVICGCYFANKCVLRRNITSLDVKDYNIDFSVVLYFWKQRTDFVSLWRKFLDSQEKTLYSLSVTTLSESLKKIAEF